ncbi:hypothetical protein [Cupriavidus plantarum]|uniref:hypothetical protein n=1 Tax=Cupriavidus plantarum TaxID=942865 RepID=UPI0015CED85C|nr:hypothetical protein [Cupriavidus plantarum]NYI02159.1 hypothetical protein [Cupriavidus plantarum]
MNEADDGVCRLRAVVATYRSALEGAALQAFTLAVSPAELMRLRGDPAPGAPDPQLVRLRDAVVVGGLALPSAIVVAVAGGRMQCESDHLYRLEIRPNAGDALMVLDGHDRLEQLAQGERAHFKTLVTAVLCHTVIDGAVSQRTTLNVAAGVGSEVGTGVGAEVGAEVVPYAAAYQTSSTSRSKWPARM